MPYIDVADDTRSLHAIGDFVMSYDVHMNAFLDALVNRIAFTIVTSKEWNDPWARFDKGMMEYGETVEEIFVNIARPYSFNPENAEATLFKREIPDVRAAFHTMNWQKQYQVTVSQEQLQQAFLGWSGITDLVSRIVQSLYTSLSLDKYLTAKYMVCREALNGGFYTVKTAAITGQGANPSDAIQKYRQLTNDLTFLKDTYNRAHVFNSTSVEDQVILMPNEPESVLGVDVLANAFNINQVDYISQRIPVDSWEFTPSETSRLAQLFEGDPDYKPFTPQEVKELQKISAMKLDKNIFMVFTNLQKMTEVYNPKGLYWNYFLHCWKTFSLSPYHNAVVFTSSSTEINGVSVSPATANVTQGSDTVFSAAVTGTGLIDKAVKWSISGNKKAGTSIDPQSGKLHVAKDEPVSTAITVTATAVDGKTGTATATVVAA